MFAVTIGGCAMMTDALDVQPVPSVTVTVKVPEIKLFTVAVNAPVDQT